MLTEQDLMKVQETSNALREPVTIRFYGTGRDTAFERGLRGVSAQISGVSANQILLNDSLESAYPDKPSVTLSVGDVANIHYLAIPEGPELGPFLQAIGWLGNSAAPPVPDGSDRVAELTGPTSILLLIAAACPHCPAVVQSALSLAVRQPLIDLTIVDAVEFTDVAQRYQVKSTPTTIIDDGLTAVGSLTTATLAEHLIRARDPESLTFVLQSMINSGRAEDAAAMMLRVGRPEALIPLYASKEFSTRMGALVTFDEALELDPRGLDSIVNNLSVLLQDEDVGLRGDTAELLGKIGSIDAVPALRVAVQDSDEDVREAAQEALEELGQQ